MHVTGRRIRSVLLSGVLSLILVSPAHGATNPVPFVNQPLVPAAAVPGGPGFTLTVNGTGFVTGAVVNWHGSSRTTTFVSSVQLTASILASDIALTGTASVTVTNPGGTTSLPQLFDVTNPSTSVGLARSDITGFANCSNTGVVTGDFNGDGKLDIVECGQGEVTVLLGNGDGTFTPGPMSSVPDMDTGFFVAADMNNDGKLDLVGVPSFLGAYYATVLLGMATVPFRLPGRSIYPYIKVLPLWQSVTSMEMAVLTWPSLLTAVIPYVASPDSLPYCWETGTALCRIPLLTLFL